MSKIDYQALRDDAMEATGGSWVRESGEGWEAICCDDAQGNAGFIIAEFHGENATANRKFVQSANPATVLSLLDEMEAAEKRIAELESLTEPQLPHPAVPSVSEGVLKSLLPDVEKSEFWFEHNGKIFFEGVRFNNAVFEACRAAMLQAEPVSNSDELPLDYLQGHKDGLEWAAQLAEANHPQTGDWLYDDQIDLARAIRKGPDMPTVQGGNSPVIPDGWISCSERMPNDAQWCVVDAADGYYVQCWSEGQGWIGDDISLRNCDVIRWMAIPEPPEQDGE
ncbi:ead/Ea22-like family protein [Escherichia coli]|nr:ead/Ea22-like family protein [Escherichia coli]